MKKDSLLKLKLKLTKEKKTLRKFYLLLLKKTKNSLTIGIQNFLSLTEALKKVLTK